MRVERWENGVMVSAVDLPDTLPEIKAAAESALTAAVIELVREMAAQPGMSQAVKDKAQAFEVAYARVPK